MELDLTHNEALPSLLEGRFNGPTAFAELIRQAFAHAADAGCRELTLSDATFFDWPLGERAVIDSLNAWARPGRKFTMLAKNYDAVVRKHPRFVTWRTTWSHLVECRASARADELEIPSVLLGSDWVLHRLDPVRSVGVAGSEPERRVAAAEALREWLERKSSPAFAASTLGL